MTQATNLTFAIRRADDIRLTASVSAAHFTSHFYILVLPPLFAFVRADYGVSYTEIALAITAFMTISAVLQTPAGFLVDRFNARLILVTGLLCGAVGLAIAAAVNSYWLLVAMFGLMGLGNTVYHPADYALLSRHISAQRMSQAYSIHTFAGLLGSAAAPAGMLFMHSLFGWRGAFLGAAVLGAAVAAALLLQPDAAAEREARPRTAETAVDTSWRLLLSPPILVSFLFFTLLAFSSFGFMNFSVVALGALHGTPAATANAALSTYLVMSAIGVLVGGFIAARTSRHGLTAAIGIAVTASCTLIVSNIDLGALLLALVMSLSGLCIGAIMPARDMIVRAVTPPGAFGKVFGFVTNGFNVGGIISPLVLGALMDQGEPHLVFLIIAAGSLLAILTVASVPKRRAG
jgi:FSR family fosmidomycin resistance protein-like MFS transporter